MKLGVKLVFDYILAAVLIILTGGISLFHIGKMEKADLI